jgi:hypothetical protein
VTAIDPLRVTAVAAAAAVLLAQSAVAAGEPKNQRPFTRPVVARVQQSAMTHGSQATDVHGEAKNGWPFTRRVDDRSRQAAARASALAPPQGEAKNEPPFVQPVISSASAAGTFNWTDGAIGVLAGIGLAVSLAGVLLIARKSPQTA